LIFELIGLVYFILELGVELIDEVSIILRRWTVDEIMHKGIQLN